MEQNNKKVTTHNIGIYLWIWGLLFVFSTFSYLVDWFDLQGLLRWSLIIFFMLIKKEVFYKLQKAYPYLKYTSDQIINGAKFKSDNCYAFFDCIIDEKSNRYLSEDYAFCRLWQKIGGKIYADLMTPLTHYGTYAFKGNVWSKFNVADKDKHKIKK